MFNKIQSLLIERFGEYIYKLIICINKFKKNITILHMNTQEMMSNIYMLSPRMLNGIFAKVYNTCIVTFNRNVIKFNVIVQQLLFLPQKLQTTKTCCNIFNFSSGQGNRNLFFTKPKN